MPGDGVAGAARGSRPAGEDRHAYSADRANDKAPDTCHPLQDWTWRHNNRLSVLEAAVDAALDSLRDTVSYGVLLLQDHAEELPEGEQREALEGLISRLEHNIERELGWLSSAMAEALEREMAVELIIRGGQS